MKSRYLVLAFSAFIFSIIAIIIAAINVPVVITHETFIGIIATFMGLCATFMVGYQIFNTLSINDKLKFIDKKSKLLDKKTSEINKKTSEINKKIANLNELYEEASININILLFHNAFVKGLAFEAYQPQTALICYLESILIVLEEDMFDYDISYKDAFHNIRKIINENKIPINLATDNTGLQIKENLKAIKEHKNYHKFHFEFLLTNLSLTSFLRKNGAL